MFFRIISTFKFDKKKAEARAHILKGLKIALDNIDEVINIIRNSYNDAKQKLIEAFSFTDVQAQAILDMRLGRLAGMEREKIENELQSVLELIEHFIVFFLERNYFIILF